MDLAISQYAESAFNRLPLELVIEILIISVFGDGLEGHLEPHRRRSALSQVSHGWKDVIEQCPFFWTDIRIQNFNDIPRVLSNSGSSVPLQVDCGTAASCDDLEQFLDLVLPYSRRWGSLTIRTGCQVHALKALEGPLPGLESLHLTFPSVEDLHLPDTISWPRVKDIRLASVILPRSFAGLANLVSLRLQNIHEAVLTSATMIGILHASPKLEVLELVSVACHEMEDAALPNDSIVNLPDLHHLSFQIPESFIYQVLLKIQADNLRLVRAMIHQSYESGRAGSEILRHLIGHSNERQSVVSTVLRNIQIHDDSQEELWDQILIAVSRWPIYVQSNGRSGVEIRVLSNAWSRPPLHPRDLLSFQSIDVTLTLWKGVEFASVLRDGIPVFDYLPSLVALCLICQWQEMINILDYITAHLGEDDASWPCPKLAQIRVEETTKWSADEMAELLGRVARLVDTFGNGPKRLDCTVPTVRLLSWETVILDFNRDERVFVQVEYPL